MINEKKLMTFSKEKQELISLCADHYTGDLASYVSEKVKTDDKSINNEIRRRIQEDVLHGAEFNHRTYRKYKNDIFEILEVVLDSILPEGWSDNEFFNQFVEVRRVDLGDTNEFYAEDNTLLTVSKFSGNHWDTNRERFDLGASFPVSTSWYVVHFYNDFERFMKNIDSFSRMLDKVRKSFTDYFQEAAYVAYSGMSKYVLADFVGNGALSTAADIENLLTICEKVEVANRNKPTIVGTTTALRKLNPTIEDFWIPEKAKQDRQNNGVLSVWESYRLLPLPQVFKKGTFDFAFSNEDLLITSSQSKPIKLVYEGASRIEEKTKLTDNRDQTPEMQLQTKAGLATIADGIYGAWHLA